MDFFSTGGLQQLLNDLNCDDVFECEDWNNLGSSENDELSSFDESLNFTTSQHEVIFGNYLEQESYNILNITNQVKVTKNDMCYGNLNTQHTQQDENSDWLENLLELHEREFNTDSNLEKSVPSTIITEKLITRELAEWEDKFLDNFIEIPELIDILPEKTPLCTDNCKLFLRESSKILKLDRTSQLSQLENETDKSFVCTFGTCNKIYAKPAHLKAHLRRHLGEKPYVCTWPNCTWKFSRSDELARHRRSHSGIKPYKCDYCSKCFARSDHLTKHRKVHERRLLAVSAAGIAGKMPQNVFNVRPGRRRKNTMY